MRLFISILLLILLAGCSNKEHISRLNEIERFLQERPDSALHVLNQYKVGYGKAEQAEYSLLKAMALYRTKQTASTDSLLQTAWDYYKHREEDMPHRFYTLYYWGKVDLRKNDLIAALQHFLKAEEVVETSQVPELKGLIDCEIGNVFYAQNDYRLAMHRYHSAKENFHLSGNKLKECRSILQMADAAFLQRDMKYALSLYSSALKMADVEKLDDYSNVALEHIAHIYAVTKDNTISPELLHRIEKANELDLLKSSYAKVDVELLKQNIDSARICLDKAMSSAKTSDELTQLKYLSFLIEISDHNYKDAAIDIYDYICHKDSLSSANMIVYASQVEKKFYQEEKTFAEYKYKQKIYNIALIVIFVLTILLLSYVIIIRKLRLECDNYMLLATEARNEYSTLFSKMKEQKITENNLKELLASRFKLVDKLGKSYYERIDTSNLQVGVFQEVKRMITEFSDDRNVLGELETVVNSCHEDVMKKLRADFLQMKEYDIRLLCYIFAGFSAQVISLFMKESVPNIYARKSRLKSRIRNSETTNKEFYLSFF